jgi:S-DNA-T family DNA segregation ATPase FtsK/SpoIIIE
MIMSILYKAPPEQARFLMIDPKSVEFTMYKDIPHLIYPVLSEPAEATLALKWAVAEMDSRYRLLAEKEVRNIETYNEKVRAELKNSPPASGEEAPRELPFLVIIIDELADLLMVSAKEVEVYITRLAQKARAAGIHLILATQRPTVDVLTGIIKANLPTRIAFQVTSKIDSRTILDQIGAEKLLGKGDMLFLPPGVSKLRRLHGANVTDAEIKKVTDFVRAWGPPEYLEDLSLPESEGEGGEGGEKDEKYAEAVELVRRTQKATISHVQRHLRIGYNRAARIIEDMEREGVIGPPDGIKPRVIL